ncbi:MAG: GTPase [Desulforegulaceae bacterium]|nr:GTPase [Desulforegulaceae bacterium]
MKDFKNELLEVLKSLTELGQGRIADDTINDIKSHTNSKLNEMVPVISLYGAYNAGKSTLLNALIGKELAKEGSSPETFRVEKYTWGQWIIFDTPGIDAPIVHEKITEEHIKKSECILFVISTDGDLESAMIFEKIAELTLRKKQLIIVLNDKSGILINEDMSCLQDIISKIDINLDKTWKKHQIKHEIKPKKFIVNARSAKKAKLENKNLLLQKSCIKDLEKNIEAFLRTKGEIDVVNSLIDYLNDPIEKIQNKIISEFKNPAQQEIEKVSNNLNFEKKKLSLKIKKMVTDRLNELAASLSSIDLSAEGSQINNHIDKSINLISDEIQQTLENDLTLIAEKYQLESRIGIIGTIEQSITENLPVLKNNDNAVTNLIADTAKQISRPHAEEITKQGLNKVFLKLREFKVPFFKGRWTKTFEKWSTKWAGPILIIASTGWEIFSSYRKQKKYEQKLISQYEAYEIMIRKTKNDLYENILKETTLVIDDFFQLIFDDINEIKKNIDIQTNKSARDLDMLKELKTILQNLLIM